MLAMHVSFVCVCMSDETNMDKTRQHVCVQVCSSALLNVLAHGFAMMQVQKTSGLIGGKGEWSVCYTVTMSSPRKHDNYTFLMSCILQGVVHPVHSRDARCCPCYVAGLFLFAAGNNGQLTDSTDITQQFFPADYGLANQISVGASDTNDALASFSNYGA